MHQPYAAHQFTDVRVFVYTADMELIIDSNLSLAEALAGKDIPAEIRETLALTVVRYKSFDGLVHQGQLLVHKDVAAELPGIFEEMLAVDFPIQKVVPIVAYGWDDESSMQDNNSSAFNYRMIATTNRLSNHSFGRAVDINPLFNPYTQYDGKVVPIGSYYDPSRPGTLTTEIAQIWKARGWIWLGEREEARDWQHFEKPV